MFYIRYDNHFETKENKYQTIPLCQFYLIRAKERAKYAMLLHCRTGQIYGLNAELQNGQTKLYFISEIIHVNPLFEWSKI